jgi:hypothetical protein
MTIRTTKPTKVPGLPKAPADISPGLRRYLESLSEAVEIRLGRRGDTRDRAVTLRELIDSGLAVELANRPFDPNGGSNFTGDTGAADTTIPPAPTGFTVNGGYSVMLLFWDAPYDQYSNHSLTEVWRHDSNVLGDAQLVGVSSGFSFSDPCGEGQSFYYWIRYVNTNGIIGPYNSTAGTLGQTALDVVNTLEVLQGAITEDAFYQGLNDRIDLIEVHDVSIGNNATEINGLKVVVNDPTTGVAATATAVNQLTTSVTTLDGEVQTLSSNVSQVNTTVGNLSTTVQTNSTSINGIEGEYSVKIDANDVVAGFGLINGPLSSAFYIRADTFAIGNTTGSAEIPFIVRTTTGTLNGVSVPAGVYIEDGFIQNGTITTARIGLLAVDTAQMANLAVTEGKIDSLAVTNAKIANAAITTAKIQDAQITTAKIGNAQVETLKIAGENVTVPRAVSAGSGVSLGAGWTQVGSITVNWGSDSSLLPSQVQFFGQLNIIATSTGTNEVTRGLRISSGTQEGIVGQSSFQGFSDCMSAGFVHTPSTGSTTYRIYGSSTGSGATAGNWFISLLGVKR